MESLKCQARSNASAGVRDLRDHLSRYLERVRAGEEVTVTDRGRPTARLVPVGGTNTFDRLIAEARAALAQAARLGRVAEDDLAVAIEELGSLYDQLDLLEVDDLLVRRAGELAQRFALRGYDGVHLAAAERVQNGTTVMVAGDGDLCAAAEGIGLAVARTHGKRA